MGPPPAVVIVATHGARLDAVDRTWHLTSPTPYDPPLTYGGWTQSRALGVRIASLLQLREHSFQDGAAEPERNSSSDGEGKHGSTTSPSRFSSRRGKRRKHKCWYGTISRKFAEARPRTQSLTPNTGQLHSGFPYASATNGKLPRLAAIPEPEESTPDDLYGDHSAVRFQKPTLRIDAFLGEWLSPEYFELITPPPSSTMMVAGAKAELLGRGESIQTSSKQPSRRKATFQEVGAAGTGGPWQALRKNL